MLYAIFSDVHSNLEAFEAFLENAKREGIEKYFCVGDIVGYGADPHACVELTKSLNCPVVCGNHDQAAAGKFDIEFFNKDAKESALWTRDALDDIDKNYLNDLKLVYRDSELTMAHGSLDHPEDFDYIYETAQAAETMRAQLTQVCFIGHTHKAGIFYEDINGYINYSTTKELPAHKDSRYLVNAGSIGQPRDGDWRSSYCIYDSDQATIRVKRTEYDAKKASDKILKAGLPRRFADRILIGR
ncbi:MAG: metallophosphoesterase family protein [Candidatus Omnitrophota bacterium]